jgi:hypothetical protein
LDVSDLETAYGRADRSFNSQRSTPTKLRSPQWKVPSTKLLFNSWLGAVEVRGAAEVRLEGTRGEEEDQVARLEERDQETGRGFRKFKIEEINAWIEQPKSETI